MSYSDFSFAAPEFFYFLIFEILKQHENAFNISLPGAI